MTLEDEKKITHWAKTLQQDIELELVLTDDQRKKTLKEFCNFLHQCSTRIKIKKTSESGLPCIRIKNTKYQMVPAGLELEPFLKLLSDPDGLKLQTPPSVAEKIEKITFPAMLKVYVLPNCTFCPKVVEQVLSIAELCNEIKPIIIDGSLFPEMVEKDQIKSAPTIILDDQFRWTGRIQLEEISNIMLHRNPADLSALSLRNIIEDGKAEDLAQMMIDNQKIFPEFLKLLIHDKWPVRLGAMVVFEFMAEKNNGLIIDTISFLWERFTEVEDTVKGDILYLLGISGNKNVLLKIESVLKGNYPEDVMEAAREAKETIQT